MEYVQQPREGIQLQQKTKAYDPLKSNNETLPQTCLLGQNDGTKGQKQLIRDQNISQRHNLKLKFNTSYDNLRCFISSPKGQNYRSVSSRLTKQSRSQACLSKLTFKCPNQDRNSQALKSQTQRNSSDKLQKSEQGAEGNQSDLSKILSDQIIHSIQMKGIKYNWKDIEEIKSQECFVDREQDQKQLQKLLNTFSDKKNTRHSFHQNLSTDQSLLTQNSTNEAQQASIRQSQPNNYSNYVENTYNPNFDNSYQKNYSFASTTQQAYSGIYYNTMQMYHMNNQQEMSNMMGQRSGLKSMPSSMFQSNEFIIPPEGLGKDPRTTIMIKNIPNKYTIVFLSEEIDQDFGNYYDFLYLPCDTKSGANQGYGFINFVDLQAIKRFYERFHGKKWRRFRSQKICNLTYARLQGINSLIQHFQNSKVLNHKQKKYQPIIKKINQQISNLIKEQQNAHNHHQAN